MTVSLGAVPEEGALIIKINSADTLRFHNPKISNPKYKPHRKYLDSGILNLFNFF